MTRSIVSLAAFLASEVEGVLLGLVYGTLPYLLRERLTIMELGVFLMITIPSSMEVFLSTVVRTAIPWSKFGAVMGLLGIGVGQIWMAHGFEESVRNGGVLKLMVVLFAMITLLTAVGSCVDSWMKQQGGKTKTLKNFGLNAGVFLSFPFFILQRRIEQLRVVLDIQKIQSVGLDNFILTNGIVALVAAGCILITPSGIRTAAEDGATIIETVKELKRLWTCPSIRSFTGLIFFWRLPFIAVAYLAPFKLLEKGIPLELIAVVWAASVIGGYFSGYLTLGRQLVSHSKALWIGMYVIQLIISFVVPYLLSTLSDVVVIPRDIAYLSAYFTAVFASVSITNIMNLTLNRLKNAVCGAGASLTLELLQGIGAIGVLLWRMALFIASDLTSVRTCFRQSQEFYYVPCPLNPPFGVATNNLCADSGGECLIVSDGFYVVSYVTAVVGFFLGIYFNRILERIHHVKRE